MSYIDIKTEIADFRVILAGHRDPTVPSQLQDNCTGVLLESNITEGDEELPYLFVEGSPEINWQTRKQYGGVIKEAEKRKISIATALSPVVEGGIDRSRELIGNYTGPYKAASRMALSVGEFSEDHSLVEALKREIENNLVVNPLSSIPYMDVMMAQSAYSLAEVQRNTGLNPFLSMIVGAFHIGTIPALRMTEKDRIKILTKKSNREIFSEEKLGNVYYVEYIPVKGGYERKFLKGKLGSI